MTPDEYKLTYTSASTNDVGTWVVSSATATLPGPINIPAVRLKQRIPAENKPSFPNLSAALEHLKQIQAELDQQAKFRPLDTPPREF